MNEIIKKSGFEINCFSKEGNLNLEKLNGFSDMLNQLSKYLQEETQWKPERRFIDAVPLLESITITAKNISQILNRENAKLKNLEASIMGGIKQ